MTTQTCHDCLVIRPSARARLPVLGVNLMMTVGIVLGALSGLFDAPLVVALLTMNAVGVLVGGVAVVQARHADWDLRLDAAGVTVRTHPTVAWTDLAEVRISGLQQGRLRRLSLGQKVTAFIAAPGVVLAGMPSMQSDRFPRWSRWARRRRVQQWGSDLAVLPSMTNADPSAVAAAVRRFSDVPVR